MIALSLPESGVLAYVDRNRGCSSRDIGRDLGLQGDKVSVITKRLVKFGLITRVADETGRKAMAVTVAGERVLADLVGA